MNVGRELGSDVSFTHDEERSPTVRRFIFHPDFALSFGYSLRVVGIDKGILNVQKWQNEAQVRLLEADLR